MKNKKKAEALAGQMVIADQLCDRMSELGVPQTNATMLACRAFVAKQGTMTLAIKRSADGGMIIVLIPKIPLDGIGQPVE